MFAWTRTARFTEWKWRALEHWKLRMAGTLETMALEREGTGTLKLLKEEGTGTDVD